MPYIEITTNIKVDEEKKNSLLKDLGKAIDTFPGKSERWLMNAVSDGTTMSFSGDVSPCIMAKVSIFGSSSREYYDKMTGKLCELFEKNLGIPKDRVYIKYEECSLWGFNGGNF